MTIDRWQGATALWNTPSNWSTGSVPGSGDIAVVLGGGQIEVGDGVNAYSDGIGALSIDAPSDPGGYLQLTIEKHANLTIKDSLSLAGTVYIIVDPSATFTVSPGATFDNDNSGVLTGLNLYVGFHSTVSLPGAPIQTLDDCAITLVGRESNIQTSAGAGYTRIEQSLTSISKGSTLDISDRNYTTTNAITNDGTLEIAGVFTSGLFTSSGTIYTFGATIASSLVSTGRIYLERGKAIFSGAADVFYQTSMSGAFTFSGGTVSFVNGVSLGNSPTVAGAAVTFEQTSHAAHLTMSSGSLILGGGAAIGLNLSGAHLSGGAVQGSGEVKINGATLGGVTLGGAIDYESFGFVTQSGGDVVLGDASGTAVTYNNRQSAIYLITDDSNIAMGASPNSVFANEGVFQKTGTGTGKSVIAPQMVDNGTITAAIGTLDFANNVFGHGALRVEVGAALEFEKFVVPYLTLTFSGPESALVLDDGHDFHALIKGFSANQSVDLAGFSVAADQLHYTPSSGGADGYLLIASGSAMANLHFEGQYQTSDFHIASDSHGGTLLTVSTA